MQNLQQNSKIPLSEKIEYFKQLQEKVLAFEKKLILHDVTINDDLSIDSNLFSDYLDSNSVQQIPVVQKDSEEKPKQENSLSLIFSGIKPKQENSLSLIFSGIKPKQQNGLVDSYFNAFSSMKKQNSNKQFSPQELSLKENDLNRISLVSEEQEVLDIEKEMGEFRKILFSIANLEYKDNRLTDDDCQKILEKINQLDYALSSAVQLQEEIDLMSCNLNKDIPHISRALINLKNKYQDKQVLKEEKEEVLDEVRSIEDNIKIFNFTDYAKGFITSSVTAFLGDKNATNEWFQTVSSAVAGYEISTQFNRQQDEFEKVEKVLEVLKDEISTILKNIQKEQEQKKYKMKVIKRPAVPKNQKTELKPNKNIQTMREEMKKAFNTKLKPISSL
jgi:hypothetical protein